MTQHVFGPAGRRRRRGITLLALTLAAGLALFYVVGAQAVHDVDVFELDRNIANDGSVLGEDWADVSAGTDTAVVDRVVHEADGATIFTQGGSKDDLDIPNWRHTDGSVPDKDDLQNGLAARYTTATKSLLYFAADRSVANGDAQLGIWFFQNKTGPVAGGTFSGTHKDGDLLVLSNFTNGGGTSNIRVFQWNGPGGTITGVGAINGTLDLVAGTVDATADCVGPPPVADGDDFCATVNSVNVTSPWDYQAKGKFEPNVHPPGTFYEGGIDLTALGFDDECFSSFLIETRSSTSVDAVLKDFIGGDFAVCGATMTTSPSVGAGGQVFPGTAVTDTAVVQGTGTASPPTPAGNVTFFLCGPIASGLCTSGGTQVGSAVALVDSSPPAGEASATSGQVNTSGAPLQPGRYCFRAEWPGDSNYTAGPFVHTGTGNSECFIVRTIPTTTVTTPVDGSGTPDSSIDLGQSIHDKAVVTGDATGGDPTGNVTFFVCKLDAPDVCDGTAGKVGTQVGAVKALVSDGAAGTFTSNATSDAFTPTSTGRYCFRAAYGGSTIYDPSSDSAATECFVVNKLPTTTVTTPVDGSGAPDNALLLGDSAFDKAVVTGAQAGGDPTGNVTFFVCKLDAPDVCDGTAGKVGTQVGAVKALVSDGVAGTFTSNATSDAYTPASVGRYCFRAVYAGDGAGGNYTGSSDSAATECFTVVANTTTATTQKWLPNDRITISSTGSVALNGTLDITLHKSANCSGAAVYTEPQITLVAEAAGTAHDTTNSAYVVKEGDSGDYSWKAVFTSSDAFVNSSTHCQKTSISIDDTP